MSGNGNAIRKLAGVVCCALCAVSTALPPAVAADGPAGNMLYNWGMESWGAAYGDYNGHMLQVAEGWTRFTTSGTEPRFMNDHEYAGLFAGSGAIERHAEGNFAQNLWLGHPFIAGIYQQVPVTPGVPYAAKVWTLIAVGSTVPDPDNKILIQIGIDPYGGTDANQPQIVWGNYEGRQKEWPDWKDGIRSAAYAAAPTITVFIRVINAQGEVKPDWNAVWLDATVLEQAPTARASALEQSAAPSFAVSVVDAQPAPNGTLTGQFDIQVKDGIDGRWHTWMERQSAGPHTYNGEVGHTYYFRARAWETYDGFELYGAFNPAPEGDTHTVVG